MPYYLRCKDRNSERLIEGNRSSASYYAIKFVVQAFQTLNFYEKSIERYRTRKYSKTRREIYHWSILKPIPKHTHSIPENTHRIQELRKTHTESKYHL